VNDDGQQEVGCRARKDDGQSLPQGASREGATSVTRRDHIGVLDSEDAHVAPKGKYADLVLGFARLHPYERAAITDREAQDLYIKQFGRDEVPKLVEDNEDTDQEEEIDDRHGPSDGAWGRRITSGTLGSTWLSSRPTPRRRRARRSRSFSTLSTSS